MYITKSHKFIAVLIGLLFIFQKGVNNTLIPKFNGLYNQFVDLTPLLSAILLLAAFGSVAWFIYQFRKSTLTTSSSLILLLISMYYVFTFRLAYGQWILIESPFLNGLYEIDLLLILLLPLITVWKNRMLDMPKHNNVPLLLEDNHSAFNKEDVLKRKAHATHVADIICNLENENSFAIGIVAPWGSGKSIFISFILERLKKDNIITVEFNPWKYDSNREDLFSMFYKNLINTLRKYDPELSNVLDTYLTKLNSFIEGGNYKLLGNLFNFFDSDKSYDQLHTSISQSFEKLNRKVVIIIDDLDRLHFDEREVVFRIIRSAFNFRNVVFIVAYDFDKIKMEEGDTGQKRFTDKIFQLEYYLHDYKKDILKDKFEQLARELLPKDRNDRIQIALAGIANTGKFTFKSSVFEPFDNLREVVRAVNELKLALHFISFEDINLDQLISLIILKIRFPEIYLGLRGKTLMQPKPVGALTPCEEWQLVPDDKVTNAVIKTMLQHEVVKMLTINLFKKNNINNRDFCKFHGDNYLLYFGYTLFSKIRLKDFRIAKTKGVNAFIAYLDGLNQEAIGEVYEIINNQEIFENKEELELNLAAAIHINRKLHHNFHYLLAKRIVLLEEIARNYYKGFETDYNNFLKTILYYNAEYPYVVESTILEMFLKEYLYGNPEDGLKAFSRIELQSMLCDLFKKYCSDEQTKGITDEAWTLFRNTKESLDPHNNIILSTCALEEFRRLITLYPHDYLYQSVGLLSQFDDNNHYGFDAFIKQYFPSPNAFKDYLQDVIDAGGKAEALARVIFPYVEDYYQYNHFISDNETMKNFKIIREAVIHKRP